MSSSKPSFDALRWTTLLLIAMLAVLIAVGGVAAWLDWQQHQKLLGYDGKDRWGMWYQALAPRELRRLRWQTEVSLAAVTSVFLLAWYALAARRFRAAGGRGSAASPLMAVLWWFIPIAGLVMPPVLMAKFLRGPPAAGTRAGRGHIVLVVSWWLACLLAALALNAGLALRLRKPGFAEWVMISRWFLINDAASMAGNALAIPLVLIAYRRP